MVVCYSDIGFVRSACFVLVGVRLLVFVLIFVYYLCSAIRAGVGVIGNDRVTVFTFH